MRTAARRDAAAGRVCSQGEAAASGRPAVGGSSAGLSTILLQEEREETGGGHTAPPQRLFRTHTHLVQHPEGAAYR